MNEFYGSIHNHTDRSNFRLRDSTNRLEELCWYAAKDLGHNFIAITDHETIATAIDCQKVEKKIRQEFPDFKIIRGNEIYLCRNGLNKENYVRGEDKFFHWVLLAKDEIGHRQIREISTRAWSHCFMLGKMLRVPTYYQDLIDIIGEDKGHVIMSTACFRKDTPVLTKTGYKPIQTITNQDFILNKKGEWEKVNYPTSRNYRGVGYQIDFLEQKQPVVCTENHKFLTIESNRKPKMQWVEAKDLNKITKTKHICLFPVVNQYNQNKEILRRDEWAKEHCKSRFIEIDNILYKKVYIKNIKKLELNEEVYCLNVDSHSFVCNDVIVHNCLGSYPSQMLLKYNETKDEELWQYILAWFNRIIEICGKENLYLETQPSYNKEQIVVNLLYKKLSEELDIPVVISLDAHYLKQEDEPIHHAFLTSQEGDRETHDFYASTYMMSREEIHEYMDNSLSEETVTEWMNNTQRIYNECEDYDLTKPTRIPYLPKTIDTITETEFLTFNNKIKELSYFYNSEHNENRDLAAAIVKKILIDPAQYNNQETFEMIDDNLKAIRLASEKMNTQWSAYLLNLRDYVDVIWNQGNSLMGPARGSGTGFLLLNMLGVTQINPLRETTKTYSFRFLNPERVSPLDVDLDIEAGKRAQGYKALQDAYGEDRVSKVLTIRTEKSKSAILTAARGLGLTPEEGADLASFIKLDRGQQRSLKQTYYGDIENDMLPDKKFQELMDGKYSELWEVAQYIEGLCCGVGRHNCSL